MKNFIYMAVISMVAFFSPVASAEITSYTGPVLAKEQIKVFETINIYNSKGEVTATFTPWVCISITCWGNRERVVSTADYFDLDTNPPPSQYSAEHLSEAASLGISPDELQRLNDEDASLSKYLNEIARKRREQEVRDAAAAGKLDPDPSIKTKPITPATSLYSYTIYGGEVKCTGNYADGTYKCSDPDIPVDSPLTGYTDYCSFYGSKRGSDINAVLGLGLKASARYIAICRSVESTSLDNIKQDQSCNDDTLSMVQTGGGSSGTFSVLCTAKVDDVVKDMTVDRQIASLEAEPLPTVKSTAATDSDFVNASLASINNTLSGISDKLSSIGGGGGGAGTAGGSSGGAGGSPGSAGGSGAGSSGEGEGDGEGEEGTATMPSYPEPGFDSLNSEGEFGEFVPASVLSSAGECPQSPRLDLGRFGAYELDLSPLCEGAARLRYVFISVAYLMAALMVYKTVNSLRG